MQRKWATPLVLLLMVAVLGFGGWWGWKALNRPVAETPANPCVIQSVGTVLKAQSVSVRVLNSGSVHGRAAAVATQLRSKGFIISRTANTTNALPTTTIIGHAVDDPEVKLVAGFFPKAVVKADDRIDHVVVVLSDVEPGFNESAPTQIAVPSGKVCLPSKSANVSTPAR